MRSPIYHIHVLVTNSMSKDGKWFAEFEEPGGQKTWLEQPFEPEVGSTQTLYIIKAGTPERMKLDELIMSGASGDEVNAFVENLAKQHGEFCDPGVWAHEKERLH